MTTKRPTKKAPAEAGAQDFLGHLDARRPFEFTDSEWTLIRGVIKGDIEGASAGRTAEASNLLKTCVAFLKAGVAPPEPASSWLIDRLSSLPDDEMLWGAEFLKRGRGKGNADEYWDQMLVAAYYDQLKREGVKDAAIQKQVVEKLRVIIPGLTETKAKSYYRKVYGQKNKK